MTHGHTAISEGRKQGEGTDQGDPLAKLAAAIAALSPADWERLAAMLAGHQRGSGKRS